MNQKNDKSRNGKSPESGVGSLVFGFLILLLLGFGLAGVGLVNLKKEIGIFTKKSRIKSRGKGVLGTIILSDKKYGYTGTRRRQYTYYEHVVRYNGFEKTFTRTRQIPIGALVPVLYLPEDTKTAIIGKPSQTVSDFEKSRFWDIFGLGFGFIIYLFLSVLGSGLVLLLIVRGIPVVLHK